MPDITQERRNQFRNDDTTAIKTCGELNFCITELISEYIFNQGLSYQTINDIVGALEGAKLEFHHRIAIPYENSKIEENGGVYYYLR